MSVPSKELRARVKNVEATLATLHADIDDIVKDRVYAAAAEISGIPVGVLKQSIVDRASDGYCRCRALSAIATGKDGL
jgi:enamine deaminase RidA (YjgF/YER057c/UK114 family)